MWYRKSQCEKITFVHLHVTAEYTYIHIGKCIVSNKWQHVLPNLLWAKTKSVWRFGSDVFALCFIDFPFNFPSRGNWAAQKQLSLSGAEINNLLFGHHHSTWPWIMHFFTYFFFGPLFWATTKNNFWLHRLQ